MDNDYTRIEEDASQALAILEGMSVDDADMIAELQSAVAHTEAVMGMARDRA